MGAIRELTPLEIFTVLQTWQNMTTDRFGIKKLIDPDAAHRWCDVVQIVAADINGGQQYSTASTVFATNIGISVTDEEVERDRAQNQEIGLAFEDPRKG